MIIQDFQDNKKGLRVLFHQEVACYQKIKEQIEKDNHRNKMKQIYSTIAMMLLLILIPATLNPLSILLFPFACGSYIILIRKFQFRYTIAEELEISKILKDAQILKICIHERYVWLIVYEDSKHVVNELECHIKVVEKTVWYGEESTVLDLTYEPMYLMKYDSERYFKI